MQTLETSAAPPARGPWRKSEAGLIRSIVVCHFDIVEGCQLRCIGCPNSTLQPAVRRITLADFERCLGNIDVKVIRLLRLFHFGEALLHHDLPTLLEAIPRQDWRTFGVEISTNAQFVDWPSFTEAIRTRILTRLVVSCDGDGTAAEYERLRPPSRWPKLIAFLTRVGELRRRFHPDLKLHTRTICTDPAAQARWRALLEPHGWEADFRPWFVLPESVLTRARPPHSVPSAPCPFQEIHNHLYVAQDGTVVPCCFHPRAAVLGNLKHQSFNQIMAGQARQALTAAMAADRAGMRICGSCTA